MILVLNSGSSSLKAKLFDNDEIVLDRTFNRLKDFSDFKKSLSELAKDIKKISPTIKITKIGHRVVHGGDLESPYEIKNYSDLKKLAKLNALAPLHNPIALEVIRHSSSLFKDSHQVAIFDTNFYRDLPTVVQTLPVDQKFAKSHSLRKYGFHGISHQFVANELDPDRKKKIISVHLGAGCSITAIYNGQAIDTSMSFTPMDGLIMQTRSGSIDPGLVLYLAKNFGVNKTEEFLNKKSGLAGMTGTDGDMRHLLFNAGYPVTDTEFLNDPPKKASKEEQVSARLAISKYCYEIGKMIAAYGYVLAGTDIIAFTGQVGFGSKFLRDKIISGPTLKDKEISIIKPNEELAIYNLIK